MCDKVSMLLAEITLVNKTLMKVIRIFFIFFLSYLNKWIPLLNTKRLAEIWYNHDVWDDYSEDCILRSSHLRNKILVDEILDKMLDLHLELLDIWFWHNPEEMINIFSLETLFEILEVIQTLTKGSIGI